MRETPSPAPSLDAAQATPVMAQFIEIKAANPDCLLFFRMGDFYELFFEDAEVASRALGIALTRRGKHLGEDIPMCGVPVHAADDYLQRLIALGHRVAVCEQLEDPAEARKRGAKAVVRRDVVRLVTPGTLTEETLLDPRQANYLGALSYQRGDAEAGDLFALAYADMSTGAFHVCETARAGLGALLARIDVRELLVPNLLLEDANLQRLLKAGPWALTPLPAGFFDSTQAYGRLTAFFAVETLAAFGDYTRQELAAAGAVIAYLEKTQVGVRPPLDPPRREGEAATLAIDAATRANLELTRTLGGEKRGSLLSVIDRTLSNAGARLLAERLASPLQDPAAIRRRLDTLTLLGEAPSLRGTLRGAMKEIPDLTRALTRLTMDRGGPRDLAAIAAGLEGAARLAEDLSAFADAVEEISCIHAALLAAPHALAAEIKAALDDDLPLLKREGGFVRSGYRSDLDRLRRLRDDTFQVIARLQADYSAQTAIKSLKIRHNGVLGYFVEVPPGVAAPLMSAPLNATFIHRQTLANALRFSTIELGTLEGQIASAGERALQLELEVFAALAEKVVAAGPTIKRAAEAMAALDVALALAELAATEGWVRPVVDQSLAFRITDGRHPVVETMLKAEGKSFIANNCDLGGEEGRLMLITGPNMAGKSTYLRQNALITILAHMGSFVPATAAHIGIIDRLFSRVGAADDLARGRSTFMVEMIETAAILNQAGKRSFVILDEIGRGTATFDGLSIAWAVTEHLHDVTRARVLFATHYHELTMLGEKLPRLANATVKVKEWKGDLIFLHEVIPGVTDRSYGIQVAKLAGIPARVVERARSLLQLLEKADGVSARNLLGDLPLFTAAESMPQAGEPHETDDQEKAFFAFLDTIIPDHLSPREALDTLYRLKAERARLMKKDSP